MGAKAKLSVLAATGVLLALAITYYAHNEPLLHDGTPKEFWSAAGRGQYYPTQDEWYVYYKQGYHGQFLYRVPKSVALADFAAFATSLEQEPADSLPVFLPKALEEWRRVDPSRTDADLLITLIRDSCGDHLEKTYGWKNWNAREQAEFDVRYARIHCYWLNIVSEFLYLQILVILAAIPWIRKSGAVAWACHLSLIPFLFFLPHYLGYAPYAFTSAGPVGGVLYPHLLVRLRHFPFGWTSADFWFIRDLPQPLLELSQTTGPMLSLSGGGGPGPIGTLSVGMLIGIAIVVLRYTLPRIHSLWNSPRAVPP